MSLPASTIIALFDAMQSHALASGWFTAVNKHEPKVAPIGDLTGAIWVEGMTPAALSSGLAATTVRIIFNVRLYTSMLSEPQDAIDPELLAATAALMEAYTGDFTLGGLVKTVDLLGMHGLPLEAQAGYIQQDSKLMRVYTITVPIVINDAWTQTA